MSYVFSSIQPHGAGTAVFTCDGVFAYGAMRGDHAMLLCAYHARDAT